MGEDRWKRFLNFICRHFGHTPAKGSKPWEFKGREWTVCGRCKYVYPKDGRK